MGKTRQTKSRPLSSRLNHPDRLAKQRSKLLSWQRETDQRQAKQMDSEIKQHFRPNLRRLRSQAADDVEADSCPTVAKGISGCYSPASRKMDEHRINLDTFTYYISSLYPVYYLPMARTQFSFAQGFQNDIEHAIKRGKNRKAPWPDKICILMLKLNPYFYMSAIYSLWKVTGRTGLVPSLLRSGLLAPIYKAGDAFKMENYHAIALLSVFQTIMKKRWLDNLGKRIPSNPTTGAYRTVKYSCSNCHFFQKHTPGL